MVFGAQRCPIFVVAPEPDGLPTPRDRSFQGTAALQPPAERPKSNTLLRFWEGFAAGATPARRLAA